MITRSFGMSTGTGYLVGSGYEGKTKELDDLVADIANRLSTLYPNNGVEIRFNNNRESGGAFIKDGDWSASIGVGAGYYSSKIQAMTSEEKISLPDKDLEALMREKDIILFHVVLDKSLLKPDVSADGCFDSQNAAFDFLSESVNPEAVKIYLEKIAA